MTKAEMEWKQADAEYEKLSIILKYLLTHFQVLARECMYTNKS